MIAFLIALIPTLSYQWPVTLDIFYHIHIAEVYSHYGFTLVDPLVNPPGGNPITYPPVFSLLIMIIGSLFKVDYFTVAKIMQPVLAFSVVLTTSYVSKKFYGNIAGISTGFLIMTSYLFTRLVSPLPETLALIFVPLVIYLYYKATVSGKYKYALISSLIFLLVILTHQATTLLLFLIITFVTLVIFISKRRLIILKNYAIFLILPLVIGLVLYGAALAVAPNFAAKILAVIMSYSTSLPFSDPISIWKYLVYLGIMLIFVVVGLYVSLKRRNCKDIFILSWTLLLFLLSYSYLVGIHCFILSGF